MGLTIGGQGDGRRGCIMKNVRFACLVLTLSVLLAHPAILRADPPETCCYDFNLVCLGICLEHHGVQLCNMHVGSSCLELCVCNDNYTYDTGGALYCPPCE